jgi:hypothetical protein
VTPGYRIASAIVIIGLLLVVAASHLGWGLQRDPRLQMKGSLRGGSLHGRSHAGGGYGYGK